MAQPPSSPDDRNPQHRPTRGRGRRRGGHPTQYNVRQTPSPDTEIDLLIERLTGVAVTTPPRTRPQGRRGHRDEEPSRARHQTPTQSGMEPMNSTREFPFTSFQAPSIQPGYGSAIIRERGHGSQDAANGRNNDADDHLPSGLLRDAGRSPPPYVPERQDRTPQRYDRSNPTSATDRATTTTNDQRDNGNCVTPMSPMAPMSGMAQFHRAPRPSKTTIPVAKPDATSTKASTPNYEQASNGKEPSIHTTGKVNMVTTPTSTHQKSHFKPGNLNVNPFKPVDQVGSVKARKRAAPDEFPVQDVGVRPYLPSPGSSNQATKASTSSPEDVTSTSKEPKESKRPTSPTLQKIRMLREQHVQKDGKKEGAGKKTTLLKPTVEDADDSGDEGKLKGDKIKNTPAKVEKANKVEKPTKVEPPVEVEKPTKVKPAAKVESATKIEQPTKTEQPTKMEKQPEIKTKIETTKPIKGSKTNAENPPTTVTPTTSKAETSAPNPALNTTSTSPSIPTSHSPPSPVAAADDDTFDDIPITPPRKPTTSTDIQSQDEDEIEPTEWVKVGGYADEEDETEVSEVMVAPAKENAARNGVDGRWYHLWRR